MAANIHSDETDSSMEAMVQTGDPGDLQGASATKVMVLEQPAAAAAASSASPTVRLVLQQCMSAQLMVQPPMPGSQPQFVEVTAFCLW